MTLAAVPLALALDAALGEPPALWRRLGHPVRWFGAAIASLDARLNAGSHRRAKGVLALVAALALFALPAAAVEALAGRLPPPAQWLLLGALASSLLAHRSLNAHVDAVASAPDLAGARAALSHIVGRDVAGLDEAGVARAGLETLAENLSDGVVAPAFWFAVAGLPGLVAYKVINTADSMIGHRTARHAAFGWCAARVDDAANLVPARLTALAIALAGPGTLRRLPAVAAQARRHASPNAGWPEGALAHALAVSLGGPRSYAGRHVDGAWLNRDGAPPQRHDLRRGLALSLRVGLIQFAVYVLLALLD